MLGRGQRHLAAQTTLLQPGSQREQAQVLGILQEGVAAQPEGLLYLPAGRQNWNIKSSMPARFTDRAVVTNLE